MRCAYRESIGAAVIILAVSTLSPRLVAQQATDAASPAGSRTTARTPWGDPDLQGIWNSQVKTPFQRPRPGEKPPENDEDGPPLGAPGNTPVLKDLLGNPTYQHATGNGPEHWYEYGLDIPTGQASLVIDPEDGRIPPMTPEAQKRRRAYDESMAGVPKDEPKPGGWLEDADPWMRCITRGLPGMFDPSGTGYNMNFLITQGPGWVAILSEMIHETRIIPLDGRPALPSNVRQWLGDSRGHWDGDTLVIETTNFDPKMHGLWQERSWYGTANTRLVERYTRVDANTIDFRYTIDDPTQYTRQWTVKIPWRTNNAPDRILEYACHEGNYGLRNILSGARARDKAAAEKAAAAAKTSGGRH
jgi:hypothetical protein